MRYIFLSGRFGSHGMGLRRLALIFVLFMRGFFASAEEGGLTFGSVSLSGAARRGHEAILYGHSSAGTGDMIIRPYLFDFQMLMSLVAMGPTLMPGYFKTEGGSVYAKPRLHGEPDLLLFSLNQLAILNRHVKDGVHKPSDRLVERDVVEHFFNLNEEKWSRIWRAFNETYGFIARPSNSGFLEDSYPKRIGVPVGLTLSGHVERERAPRVTTATYQWKFHVNCYTCHAGLSRPGGQVHIGSPNHLVNLGLLSKHLSYVERRFATPLGWERRSGIFGPANFSFLDQDTPLAVGQSYAGALGIMLTELRANPSLEFKPESIEQVLSYRRYVLPTNVMPWWWARGPTLYSNAALNRLERNTYALGQQYFFPHQNGKFLKSEEFAKNMANIEALVYSVEPPRWEGQLDRASAKKGHEVFERRCATCHNDSSGGVRPEVRTDMVLARTFARFRTDFVRIMKDAFEGNREVTALIDRSDRHDRPIDRGYRAPSLVGVLDSRPLAFHNASVPLKWVFFANRTDPRDVRIDQSGQWFPGERRPLDVTVDRIALDIEGIRYGAIRRELPRQELLERLSLYRISPGAGRRLRFSHETRYVDMLREGGGIDGHYYAYRLDDEEKWQVLEYLKIRCELPTRERARRPEYGVRSANGERCIPATQEAWPREPGNDTGGISAPSSGQSSAALASGSLPPTDVEYDDVPRRHEPFEAAGIPEQER